MNTETLTKAERDLIIHTLGLTPRGSRKLRRWSYRNHFYTAPEGEDGAICEALVKRGFMYSNKKPLSLTFGMFFYFVTEAGAGAAGVLDRFRKEDRHLSLIRPGQA